MNILSQVFRGESAVLPHVTWPLAPFDDESLAGFVARTCSHNGIRDTSVLTLDAGIRVAEGGGHLARKLGDFGPLAALLAVAPEWVESRRHRALKERVKGPGLFVDFHGAILRRIHFDHRLKRFAPEAVLEKNYHREIWHISTLPACGLTGELLVEVCQQPGCGKPLLWGMSEALGRCSAPECKGMAEPSTPLSVPDEEQAGLSFAAALIDPSAAINEPTVGLLPASLRSENRGDLFELIWILGCLDHRAGIDAIKRPKTLSALARSAVLACGAARLLSWPSCIADVLGRSTGQLETNASIKKTIETLQAVVRNPGTFGRAAELLAVELQGISTNAFSTVVGQQLGMITATEFSRKVGLQSSKVATLQRSAHLPRILFSEGKRDIALFSPFVAQDVRARLADRLPFQSFASETGLGIDAIELLVAAGMLPLDDDPMIQALWPNPHLDRAIATSFHEQLVGHIKSADPPAGSIKLSTALYGCHPGDKPWPAIIDAILAGRIRLYAPGKKTVTLRACLISPQDLPTLYSLRGLSHVPQSRSEWLNEADTQERLALSWRGVRSLLASGRLNSSGLFSGLTYRRCEVDAIAREFVSIPELQAKLGVTRWIVKSILRSADLTINEDGLVSRHAAREKLNRTNI